MPIDPFSIGASAAAGLALKIAYDAIRERMTRQAEWQAIGKLSVAGDWFAAWQASVDGCDNINIESVRVSQRGSMLKVANLAISQDNPRGGYLWQGKLNFRAGRKALGRYWPVDRSDRDSEGVLFLIYNSPRKLFIGEWVGSAYDGELCRGYVVIAKDAEQARRMLNKILDRQPVSAVINAEVVVPEVAPALETSVGEAE